MYANLRQLKSREEQRWILSPVDKANMIQISCLCTFKPCSCLSLFAAESINVPRATYPVYKFTLVPSKALIYVSVFTAAPTQRNDWQKNTFLWRAPSWKHRLKLSVGIYVAPFKSNDSLKCSRDARHIQPLHTSKHTHSSYTSSHSQIQSTSTLPPRLFLWVQFGPLPKDTDMLTGQARNSTPSTEPQGLLLSFSTSQLWLLPHLINSSSWQVPYICLDKST